MTRTQEELMKLLCEFDDLCTEHGIEYILAGGLALGAVRNGGFLPWDDDIDILIKRSEYEKLNTLLEEKRPEQRSWVTEDNSPDYRNPVSRYVDDTTTLFFKTMTPISIAKGYHLEIFIMDPYPSDPEEQLKFQQMLWLYTELRNPYFRSAYEGLPPEVTDQQLYEDYRKRTEEEGMTKVISEIKSYLTGFSPLECHLWCGRWSRNAYVFEDEWVGQRRMIEIGGREFPIGRGIFHHMRENYDSHWNLIPEVNKQHTHPSISSLQKSWRDFQPEIDRVCEKYSFRDHLEALKPVALDTFFERMKRNDLGCGIIQALLEDELSELEKRKWNFSLDKKEELKASLKWCIDSLCHPIFVRSRRKLDIRRDILETIFLLLVHEDRYEDACRVAAAYGLQEGDEGYGRALESLGEMKLSKYYEDEDGVRAYLEELGHYPQFAHQIEIERTELWLKVREYGDTPCDAKQIERIHKSFYHRDDEEILKYIADLYYTNGQDNEKHIAMELYSTVTEKSRNGMLLYDLQKRGLPNEAELSHAEPSHMEKAHKEEKKRPLLQRAIGKLRRRSDKRPHRDSAGKILLMIRAANDEAELVSSLQDIAPESMSEKDFQNLLHEISVCNQHIRENEITAEPHNQAMSAAYEELQELIV